MSVWHDLLERPSLRRVEVICERAHFWLEDDVWGPVHWTRPGGDEGSVGGTDLTLALGGVGIEVRNPDQAFIESVARGAPGHPGLRHRRPGPPGGRRPVPLRRRGDGGRV